MDGDPSVPDRRKVRTDTLAYVTKLEDRIRTLEAQLALAEGREHGAGVSPVDSNESGALAARLAVLELDAEPTKPAGYLCPDQAGDLRWHSETSIYAKEQAEPVKEDDTVNLPFLPVPLSNELHLELIDLAYKWHFDTVRLVERDDIWLHSRRHSYSPFVHLAVLATGSRYLRNPPPEICDPPSDPNTRGEPFLRAALELVTDELADPKFSTIRGLMVIATYLGGIGRPRTGWLYGGLAQRVCIDFGLHIDPPVSDPISAEMRASRRRTFWACFTHDVHYSICFGRRSAFSLSEIHQPLPALPPASECALPGQGASWAFDVRLNRIGWKVCWLCYTEQGLGLSSEAKCETAKRLWNELSEWRELLPSIYNGSSMVIDSPDTLHLNLSFHTITILLLKPFLDCSTSASIRALAHERCTDAAASIAWLAREYTEKGPGFEFSNKLACIGLVHGAGMSLELACRALTPSPSSSPSLATPVPSLSPPPLPPLAVFDAHLSHANTDLAALLAFAHSWPSSVVSAAAITRLRGAAVAQRDAAVLASSAPPVTAGLEVPTMDEPAFPPRPTLLSLPLPFPSFGPDSAAPASAEIWNMDVPAPGSAGPAGAASQLVPGALYSAVAGWTDDELARFLGLQPSLA
ncbi:hypothetical protein Rhopal_007094-T1 [Rhodotorula paludigena]|uniref:Xylanolytic transcriptional activator regulatory domain-containing protein n=1 Tax=Rhodotorula paludigena TaxID=86838 RepID=A0AAV5GX10_9BASI|nr:hypothetical protein Rhopal_007094-T1 [Rhodotorula paludigena]